MTGITGNSDIQKGLEQDAQVILLRVPENPNAENTREIADALVKFVEDNGISRAKVARWIGYSPTVLSEFVAGRYNGSHKNICNKLVNLFNGVHRKQQLTSKDAFIPTTVANRIFTMIKATEAFSIDEGKCGIVIGDGGHGQSVCLREYAKSNLNSAFVELDSTMTSTAIFARIARELELDASGSLPAIAERLVDALRPRHMIILLDEASSLTVKQLNQLRQIILVKSRCPLILSGNKYLLETIMQPSTRRGCESLDQFTSRLMGVLNLDELAIHPQGGLYTAGDVRKLYEFGGVRLTTDAVDAIRHICMTPQSGRLRTCTLIIKALHVSKAIEKKPIITARLIVDAIDELDLPVKMRLPLLTKESLDQLTPKAQTAVG